MSLVTNLPTVYDPNHDDNANHRAFDDIPNQRQRHFLQALARTGSPTAAERITGITRDNHYFWLQRDTEERKLLYSAAVKRAIQYAGDAWEDEAAQRAFLGYQKAIVHKGEITGYTIEKSDILTMFMLNGARPEKYHRSPDQGSQLAPTTINITNYSDNRTINVTKEAEQVAPAAEQIKVGKW